MKKHPQSGWKHRNNTESAALFNDDIGVIPGNWYHSFLVFEGNAQPSPQEMFKGIGGASPTSKNCLCITKTLLAQLVGIQIAQFIEDSE